ncbi:MAG: molybdopterin guanine dinucleotide synthesis, partial [Yoonia sp.]
MTYDSFVMVDWSGGNDRGAKPTSDAIWVGISRGDTSENPMYFRNRQVFAIWARGFIETELAAGR